MLARTFQERSALLGPDDDPEKIVHGQIAGTSMMLFAKKDNEDIYPSIRDDKTKSMGEQMTKNLEKEEIEESNCHSLSCLQQQSGT